MKRELQPAKKQKVEGFGEEGGKLRPPRWAQRVEEGVAGSEGLEALTAGTVGRNERRYRGKA